MEILKQGSTGDSVRDLQRKLNKVLDANLVVDGQFGPATVRAVRMYQGRINKLVVDGIVGPQTMTSINRFYAQYAAQCDQIYAGKFAVFVDAGHGGIDDSGRYVTPGKRAHHEGVHLHDELGNYYEGHENRIVAAMFMAACADVGIPCIPIHHPYKDTPLGTRSELVTSYMRRGYAGYLHSFHSNAISSKNSPEKLESTKGYMVFSALGNNFSDQIAAKQFENVKAATNNEWVYRTQMHPDGDVDYEVNFQILRETDLVDFSFFGAILSEWGFHTSKEDTLRNIIGRRAQRVEAALETAKWVHDQWKKQS